MDRRLAGLGCSESGVVQAPLEICHEALIRLCVGPRPARRRHLPAAQLPRAVLEHFRVRSNVVEVDAFERQARFASRGVMAVEAIAADDALVTRRELLVGRLAARGEHGRDERRKPHTSAFHKRRSNLEKNASGLAHNPLLGYSGAPLEGRAFWPFKSLRSRQLSIGATPAIG